MKEDKIASKELIDIISTQLGKDSNKVISKVPDHLYYFVSELLSVSLNSITPIVIIRNGSSDANISSDLEALVLHIGDDFDPKAFLKYQYERVSKVLQPGEFSLYGDVIVFWSYGSSQPHRLSLWGTEIESIQVLDVETRKSLKELKSTIIVRSISGLPGVKEVLFDSTAEIKPDLQIFQVNNQAYVGDSSSDTVDFGLRSLPFRNDENINLTSIVRILSHYHKQDYKLFFIDSHRRKGADLPKELFDLKLEVINGTDGLVSKGFVSTKTKQVYVTSYEVFGDLDLADMDLTKSYEDSSINQKFEVIKRDEVFKKVQQGDLVVHEDHGVGKYTGLVERGSETYMFLKYAGKDVLLVPLKQAKKVTKYIGGHVGVGRLTPLNSGAWRRIKKKANEDAEKLAKQLVQLYSMRQISQPTQSMLERLDKAKIDKFISSFQFEDTEDQVLATEEIMGDLFSGKLMDRLLIGDVAFGKTEVAMRAMFAVANAGFQVALLAPTTILVEQHLAVLRDRFKESGLKIRSLSRFLSHAESLEVIKELHNGKVDIVVGTHSLLSDKIHFNNLGLIIIDEEQKFGVEQKEKLKKARIDAHVLSMTATPIPRTLNMSLSGIRDISVIRTPPEGRKPIINKFEKLNWDEVSSAIKKELSRNGQVYFLHNRVRDIEEVGVKLAQLFPDNKVDIAHGQLSPEKLSKVMNEFGSGKVQILVCTTIIENGLDMPNVNTLVVENAERFGLSQLYQIRGRVGRSSKQAYAYFFYQSSKGNSQARLDALAEAEELGSGFILSNRDLEIRGAGNVLGKEQSGAIASVGYGMFIGLLNENVRRLKEK
ncbi:DEAD/DEAH box helicase [Candidatus Dojkabacteria bacterium]|uniref:DEAD/DEAH box helicase n=1 Tax=Candidatus Dojkabacteria bacterium TaxID=2099670 RepID=A0A955KWN4_9BACT|nr:DEAD/DEAH box helicase [Candidatus Dojkabacteria bacterium]